MVSLGLVGIVESYQLAGFEDLFEMELLSKVSDVYNTVGLQVLKTVTESSNISGVVVESSVRLANNQRDLLLGNEDAGGSVV